MTHIFDAVERDTGIIIGATIGATIDDVQREWRRIVSHHATGNNPSPISNNPPGGPYDFPSNPATTGAPVSAIADLRNNVEAAASEFEGLAAKVARYERNPFVSELVDFLEAVPAAEGILRPVLAGVNALAAVAPAPAPAPAPEPAPASAEPPVVDLSQPSAPVAEPSSDPRSR